MNKLKFNAIAAASKDLGIGYQGGLPWDIPNEMKYFNNITKNHNKQNQPNIVIMGRKTYESIP